MDVSSHTVPDFHFVDFLELLLQNLGSQIYAPQGH